MIDGVKGRAVNGVGLSFRSFGSSQRGRDVGADEGPSESQAGRRERIFADFSQASSWRCRLRMWWVGNPLRTAEREASFMVIWLADEDFRREQ